ncbi:hypothetical protein PX554_18025 [Sphingomonas sp. H39-1-10]|uniref:hypothetical protein n=1 Tax=Sphingomonas pollutisoli TaxID=3030829 RepID=UPI0023B8D639|nr:hypothetical protein [Sphingomonas pollutisoli]MDF0490037.1 hypothetical protein [Sphingomonas pollutisoli]
MKASEVYAGYKPTAVSKHRALNNVHLKAVIDRLVAAGDHEAADTIIWQMWWRDLDAQRERFLIEQFREQMAERLMKRW